MFRLGLFAFLTLGVILFYTGTQFYGLRDAQAMDLGQLAQNLRAGRGYVTKNIRPADLHHLNAVGQPTLQNQRTAIPELWTPPVYPWVLSWALRGLEESPGSAGAKESLRGDRVLMLAGWVFFVLGLALMYTIGMMLFDRRVAVLAAFLYLFCDPLLDSAIAGLPTGFHSTLLLLLILAILKAEQWQAAGKPAWWVGGAVAGAAVVLGIGILTDYMFAALLLPLSIYLALVLRKKWRSLVLGAVVIGVIVTPWILRNYRVSRTLLGLSHYRLIEGVGRGTPNEIREGQVQRTFAMPPHLGWKSLAREALMNSRKLYEVTIKEAGAGYLMVFFLASLLHRFRRDEVFRLRRLVFWGLLAMALWFALEGVPERNPLTFFLPVVMLYAAAFFYVLFERLRFRTRVRRAGMVLLFVGVNCIPFGLAILPPRDTYPYPPYAAEVPRQFGVLFAPTEILVSDIPWAVAWYADRGAIWAPLDQAGFMQIHDGMRNIAGIYLTQKTLSEPNVLEWVGGYHRFWIGFFGSRPPPGFPLQESRGLTPDGQQILISNRPM